MSKPKYTIGQKFTRKTKRWEREYTVIDIHSTFNAAGALVKLRYVCEYEVAGQFVVDRDIPETTLARCLYEEKLTGVGK